MAGPVTFNTPDRLILYALIDAGIIPEGQPPSSELYAEAANRLNDIVNHLQTQGLKLWTQEELTIALTQGVGAYSLGPGGVFISTRPLRVLQGIYQDNNNIRRPLIPLSRDEYTRLSILTQQGPMNSYFVDKQQTNVIVNVWYPPDAFTAANGTMRLVIQQQITNFTGLEDTMNFPIEWFLALRWILADEMCSGQPVAVQARCAQRAAMFRMQIEDWDVEDPSTMFTTDQRSAYSGGNFR